MVVTLRNARVWPPGGLETQDVSLPGVGTAGGTVDLEGRTLLPGLVNAHDHLDFSTFPMLGRPPYPSAYAWARDVEAGRGDPAARDALRVPLPDRLFLGGLRNLLAGVTAVAHHNPYHRSLGRPDFPVRVLAKYEFAHSPGLTPELKKTYRTTDRRIPWMVHAGEGVDEEARGDLARIREANCLRQNTVLVHGVAFGEEDARAVAEARACVVWCPESNRRLYGATADLVRLRRSGLRVGLGSDSPISGVRDALSNLAAARAEGSLADPDLLALATAGSAEVARLPLGGVQAHDAHDLLVVESLERLLAGERAGVALMLVRGRPLYGLPSLMAALAPDAVPCFVDGHERRLDRGLARRARAIRREHPGASAASWFADVRLDP